MSTRRIDAGAAGRISRRRLLVAATAAAAVSAVDATADGPRRIAVLLRKFEIAPPELPVAEGESVLFALSALDAWHRPAQDATPCCATTSAATGTIA